MNLQELFPLPFSERPLRFPTASADLLKLVQQELARLQEQHQQATDGLLVPLAQTCFHLERVSQELKLDEGMHAASAVEALTIIAENLRDLLVGHQTRWEDYTGRTWTAEMRGEVDLRGHQIRDELAEPRVAHMELPVVFQGQRQMARGAAIIDTPRRDGSSL
jgi:GAF domain-containing protein